MVSKRSCGCHVTLAVTWQTFNVDMPLYYSVVSYNVPPPHLHQCTFCCQLQCSPTPPPSVYILLSVTMFPHPTSISVHSVVSYNVPPPHPHQCTFCCQLQCSPTPPPSVYILLSVTMFPHPTSISVHSVVSYNVPPPHPHQCTFCCQLQCSPTPPLSGKYIGSRPVKLRKSTWKERNIDVVRKKEREKQKLGLR